MADRRWFPGDAHSIAVVSTLGSVNIPVMVYKARELIGFDEDRHVVDRLERGMGRLTVRGCLGIPART